MRRLLLLLASLSTGLGCSDGADRRGEGRSRTSRRPPVLLIAVDGLEWSEMLPLLDGGELPVVAGLMRTGRWGRLRSMVPTVSPVIWTSVATSRAPEDHGIQGFVKIAEEDGPRTRLFNSHDRRAKAFWNILSERGLRVGVVGWWMTFPVEPIDGLMVAQVNTLERVGENRPLMGGLVADLAGQVHPPSRTKEILAIQDRVLAGFEERMTGIFGKPAPDAGAIERRLWEDSRWSFRSDAAYLEIARAAEPESFDVFALYVGGTDVVGHRFWRYAHPAEFVDRPVEREVADLGGAIADYYRYIDGELGRVLDRYPVPPTVILISDHGMHASRTELPFVPDDPAALITGNHDDGPAGVVILSGPRVRPWTGEPMVAGAGAADLPVLGTVMDITPTLLALMDVPAGRDMLGEVWGEHLEVPDLERVATHDDDSWRTMVAGRRPDEVVEVDADERFEQLRALGYVR